MLSRHDWERYGIDFDPAQALWDDPDSLKVLARTTDEARYLVIGRIGERHWSAVITHRDERIRLISVRRSRKEEVTLYENESI